MFLLSWQLSRLSGILASQTIAVHICVQPLFTTRCYCLSNGKRKAIVLTVGVGSVAAWCWYRLRKLKVKLEFFELWSRLKNGYICVWPLTCNYKCSFGHFLCYFSSSGCESAFLTSQHFLFNIVGIRGRALISQKLPFADSFSLIPLGERQDAPWTDHQLSDGTSWVNMIPGLQPERLQLGIEPLTLSQLQTDISVTQDHPWRWLCLMCLGCPLLMSVHHASKQ